MRWCIPCIIASLLALAALVAFVSLKMAIDGNSCPPAAAHKAWKAIAPRSSGKLTKREYEAAFEANRVPEAGPSQ